MLLAPPALKVRRPTPRARVPQGLQTIELVDAGIQHGIHAFDLARFVRDARIVVLLVLYRTLHHDFDAIHKINDLAQPAEVDQHVVMHVDAIVVENRLPQQIKATKPPAAPFTMRIHLIQPVHAPDGHPGEQVPWQAQHGRCTGRSVYREHNDGVGALVGKAKLGVAAQQQNVHEVVALSVKRLQTRRYSRDVLLARRRIPYVAYGWQRWRRADRHFRRGLQWLRQRNPRSQQMVRS